MLVAKYMQTHEIKRTTKQRKKVQVGRGGKRGKTSGRGTKGQNARAGRKKYPEIRNVIKKLPKLRGYRFHTIQKKALEVNLDILEKNFAAGDKISPREISEKIFKRKGDGSRIKILNKGELTKKLEISGCLCSKGAKEKIESVGGTII